MELEKGKLYQVCSYHHDWVIAEYTCKVDAHIARGYRSSDGAREWPEPTKHWFKSVAGKQTVILLDKGLKQNVRPVIEETLAEIARLQAEIERIGKEQKAVIRELYDLCGRT